jgi:two-component system KDP operon response regulator KdpE
VPNAKILVIDDEPQIRRVMRTTLTAQGYEVIDAKSGEEGLEKLREELPDLVLLDMNMPRMGGLETCRLIRTGSEVPIIMLTVKNTEKDKVEALDAGADDYVTKPFSMQELLARIRAALRRMPAALESAPRLLVLGDVEIDFEARKVSSKSGKVHLTPKEFDLLRQLLAEQGKVISHRKLLQSVWGPDYGDEVEYLRVFINQLRKKIEPDPSKPRFILTEPWVGYRLSLPENTLTKS